jgi:hypothetical protein
MRAKCARDSAAAGNQSGFAAKSSQGARECKRGQELMLSNSRKTHDVGIPRQKLLQKAFEERIMRNRHLWMPPMGCIYYFEYFPRPLNDDLNRMDIPDGPR